MTKEEKLFRKEEAILNQYSSFTNHDASQPLKELTRHYKTLLDQTRFLTWISGRLERKLQRLNRDLQKKNQHLENTIEELRRARAGKMAYAIIYIITIALFVLEEYFVEPVIEVFGEGVGFSILFKLIIVLLLKFAEGFIEERFVMKKIMR